MIQFENHLNKVKLVQSGLNIFLALKLVRCEPIVHLLCYVIQFNMLMINDISSTLCSVFSNIIFLLFSQVIYITGRNIYLCF